MSLLLPLLPLLLPLQVKPIINKLRSTLIGSGAALLTCAVLLSGIISASSDADGMYGRGAAKWVLRPAGSLGDAGQARVLLRTFQSCPTFAPPRPSPAHARSAPQPPQPQPRQPLSIYPGAWLPPATVPRTLPYLNPPLPVLLRGGNPGRQVSDGVIFSKRVTDLSELKEDDELAAAEAAAAVSGQSCSPACLKELAAFYGS